MKTDGIVNRGNVERNLSYFEEHHHPHISYLMSIGEISDKRWWEDQTPHVAVIGGTHGNEPAGVEAIIRIHEHLQREKITPRGRVTFILGNPEAYARNERYLERDLNRAFSNEISAGIVEGRRALELRRFLQEGEVTSVLDLHSVSKGNFKMAVYSAENPHNQELAKKVSSIPLHFMYHPEHLAGTLMDEANSFGIEAMAVECGNHAAPDAVDTAVEHLARFLVHYSLIQQSDMPQDSFGQGPNGNLRCYETIQTIKPGRGFRFLNPDILSEDPLQEGEVFAQDEDVGLHHAPQDCYVMMPSKTIKPTDTDAGFLCMRQEDYQ